MFFVIEINPYYLAFVIQKTNPNLELAYKLLKEYLIIHYSLQENDLDQNYNIHALAMAIKLQSSKKHTLAMDCK